MGYTQSPFPALQNFPTDAATGFYTEGVTYGMRFQFKGEGSKGVYLVLAAKGLSTPLGGNREEAIKADLRKYYPDLQVRSITIDANNSSTSSFETANSPMNLQINLGYIVRQNRISLGIEAGLYFITTTNVSWYGELKERNSNNEYFIEQYKDINDNSNTIGPNLGVDLAYRLNSKFEIYGIFNTSISWYSFQYTENLTNQFTHELSITDYDYSGHIISNNIMAGIRYYLGY